MNETTIKNKIVGALGEVCAPKDLVERMAVRATSIVNGRKAEQQLSEMGSAHPDSLVVAQCVVGRLMMSIDPPNGISVETMTKSLVQNQKFCQLSDAPASELLNELKTGRLIRELGVTKARKVDEPVKKAPEKELAPKTNNLSI